MSFIEAVSSCLRQYVGFSGRARRSEFWYFSLFGFLLGVVAAALDPTGGLGGLVTLGLLLPSLAVGVRRLHDTGRTGWWWLIIFIPFLGAVVLIVFWATDGDSSANRYGPPTGSADGNALVEPPAATHLGARIQCPRCGESIAAEARVCRFCNHELRSLTAD